MVPNTCIYNKNDKITFLSSYDSYSFKKVVQLSQVVHDD